MPFRHLPRQLGAVLALAVATETPAAGIVGALKDGPLGLHDSAGLKLDTGRCSDCATVPQALWYFGNEIVAAPDKGVRTAGHSTSLPPQADVADHIASKAALDDQAPLIWLGSSSVIPHSSLSADGKSLLLDQGQQLDFAITPQLPSNRSYYNADSQKFFAQRPLRVRGEAEQLADGRTRYIARTVWPLDYAIRPDSKVQALSSNESLRNLVKSDNGGARQAFSSRLLWEKNPGSTRSWDNKAVLGIMLNGAQGDDDEAHGGHFAIATGRYRNDGDWSRWMVYNFYDLATISEKGIVAAPTPMDNYMFDLNSGQTWYRPSYMLVAVLKNDQTALQYQAGIERIYNRFYRHDLEYSHSAANCAGISVDTLRTLGWQLPERGHAPLYKAIGAYLYVAITNRSLSDGRKIYDYLLEESTRLYPAVSFDALGEDLLKLAQGSNPRKLTAYESALANDVEAIYYVHIPQTPSSRAYGLAPVYSFDEFLKQAPENRDEWQVVPNDKRDFPEQLRDSPPLPEHKPALIPAPVAVLFFGLFAVLSWATLFIRRRCKTA